ncbi:ATP-binding protein [Lactobacillus gallinarum]|uniref:ATP-binding protein n=1 Tax=Lactobacillus gallinarum TaxID=52242 RepID=UPI0024B0DD1E|nr:ATP-binding protein [Lactobacillus gallinarum]
MSEIDKLFTISQQLDNNQIERYKAEFYIGKISRVYKDRCYVQTDNFSLLKSRINRNDFLVPNTINYLVVIESITGIYLAEVISSQLNEETITHDALINNNDASLHPLIQLKVIGIYQKEKFTLLGFSNVGIGDKVYIATSKVEEIYQSSLEIINNHQPKKRLSFANMAFFGKKNIPFEISPNGLLSNHFMILGATNSGKSTSALSILEQLHNQKIKFILIDPTGEYCSAFKNDGNVDSLTLGENTVMRTGKITDQQWLTLLNPNTENQEQQLIDAISELKIAKVLSSETDYHSSIVTNGLIKKENNSVRQVEETLRTDIPDDTDIDIEKLIPQLQYDAVEEDGSNNNPYYISTKFKRNNYKWLIDQVNYKLNKLKLVKFLGDVEDEPKENQINKTSESGQNQVFIDESKILEESKKEHDLLKEISELNNKNSKSLYVNASKIGINNDSGKMVIDLLCNELLSERMAYKLDNPKFSFEPIILFIDEVHRYALEKDINGNYSTGLINIAREGRKYGIFLFLTSQSPKDIPSIILNQIGTLLVHNLTGKDDLKVISNYFDDSTLNSLGNLGQGDAILTGVNLIKNIQLRIKPSALTQNNKTPYIGE